ncbi:MAG: TMEM175 family protein, partial [Methanoregulaceae archaeon]|nr:TMEM175 family protein [Methanoregulaceae archaeon]
MTRCSGMFPLDIYAGMSNLHPSMRDADTEGFVSKTNIERITNGIFAFTMTLLARNILLPPEKEIQGGEFLVVLFERIGIDVIGFVIAFLVLAMLWFFIYQIYRNITSVDRPFCYVLMVFLMTLVSVPFASQIDNTYANPAAAAIFQADMFLLGVLCIVLWVYATRSPLANPGITPRRIAFQALKYAVIPALSVIALYESFSGSLMGDTVFLAAPFIYLIF